MESLPYRERLIRLKLFSFQGRLLRNNLVIVWKIFNNKCGASLDQLFRVAPTVHTQGLQYKLILTHSRLDIKQRFFSVIVIFWWNSLSTERRQLRQRVLNNSNVCSTDILVMNFMSFTSDVFYLWNCYFINDKILVRNFNLCRWLLVLDEDKNIYLYPKLVPSV